MVELVFLLVYAMYTALLLIFIITWMKIPQISQMAVVPITRISVLVAARNEEHTIENLLLSLSRQTYPASLYEVILIDDFSSDNTRQKVLNFISSSECEAYIQLITPDPHPVLSGKKAAIQSGIARSTGSLIVTIDADCEIGPKYLETIEAYYRTTYMKMITGPVVFKSDGGIVQSMQQIEFASLIGAGAVTLTLGFPTMCNGANLIYEKDAFYVVNGFEGNEAIASGDDEFLMHKLHFKYPGKVAFLKSSETVVVTNPSDSIQAFINQRKRWASKWAAYEHGAPKVLAVFIFIYNLTVLATLVSIFTGGVNLTLVALAFLFKALLELLFLWKVLDFMGSRLSVPAFIILQIIYPFYVSFFGIFSKSGKYSWKGRKLK